MGRRSLCRWQHSHTLFFAIIMTMNDIIIMASSQTGSNCRLANEWKKDLIVGRLSSIGHVAGHVCLRCHISGHVCNVTYAQLGNPGMCSGRYSGRKQSDEMHT